MAIWYRPYNLKEVQQRGIGTMVEHIGITITEVGENFLKGTMPVDHRTVQPMGILHGGRITCISRNAWEPGCKSCC